MHNCATILLHHHFSLVKDNTLHLSKLSAPEMDCPSEERLIRIALYGMAQIEDLSFDFGEREVIVVHHNEIESILQKLQPIGLGIRDFI